MTVLSSTTALTLPQLSPLANLDGYIRAVQQFPLLSARQEEDCALKFRTLGDLEAARMLVLSHLRLVVAVSRQYLGYGLPQADLIQEGNVGLMKAVKRFDPTQGVRLVSYALHWIKAEIHEYILRNWQMVKVATTKAQRKLFFNLKSLKRALGADAAVTTDQAQLIARELNVSRDEVMEMDRRLSGGDTPLEPVNDDGETVGPIASLAAENADPAYLVAEAQEAQVMGAQLRTALEGLDPRSRAIVQARWLADSDDKGPTLHDLAAEYGVSAERVRQIEAAALKKIKKLMLAH
ncbi:MAG: RNA polymerase sigma factor RpoH [Burkholderiaceae bacterium]